MYSFTRCVLSFRVTGCLSPTMDTSVNGATEALSVSSVEVPIYLKPIDLQAFLGR